MQATSRGNNFGNCRCCLAIGHHEHTFGIPEMEILMENLNLFLLADPRLPRGLCSKCFSAMANVQLFRQRVLMTEAELHRILKRELYSATSTLTSDKVVQQAKNEPFETIELKSEVTLDPLECHRFHEHTPESHQNNCSEVMKIKLEPDDIQSSLDDSTLDVAVRDSKESSQNKSSQGMEIKSDQEDIKSNPDESVLDMAVSDSEGVQNIASDALPETKPITRVRPTSLMKRKLLDGSVKKNIALATDITKTRANINLVLQNSTVLPFRCTREHIFRCFYCEKKFRLFKDLRNHTELDHKNDVQDFTILELLRLRKQKAVHADISNASCKMCNEKFENLDDLVKHLINIHNKVYYSIDSEKGPPHGIHGTYLNKDVLKCHICEKEFLFYVQLSNHMNAHYDCLSCPICKKKTMSESRLKRHLWYHENTDSKCPECNKTFSSKYLMRVHRNRYHLKVERPVTKCIECNEIFHSISKKFQHMEIEHGITRPEYKCQFCKSKYKNSNSLQRHIKIKHNLRARELFLVCEKCAYATMDSRTMRMHMEHHNGVRNFECDYCKKKLRTKRNIELHIRMHINKKKYSCRLCDASYIQKHCVKTHIQTKHPNSSVDINIIKIEE